MRAVLARLVSGVTHISVRPHQIISTVGGKKTIEERQNGKIAIDATRVAVGLVRIAGVVSFMAQSG